tara:strand:- start:204 stop:479 length:276 start_codon:yes stop_codon:yes gene_type:complete
MEIPILIQPSPIFSLTVLAASLSCFYFGFIGLKKRFSETKIPVTHHGPGFFGLVLFFFFISILDTEIRLDKNEISLPVEIFKPEIIILGDI